MIYNKKVLEHFTNPRNAGELKDPDAIGKVGNIVCGDVLWIYIKVKKDKDGKEIIDDIKFKTFGCVAAIATSSITTELVKGKPVEEALKITEKDIVKALGGLPKAKVHCSLLAVRALREAIYQYLKKSGREIPKWLEKEHERIEKQTDAVEKRYNT